MIRLLDDPHQRSAHRRPMVHGDGDFDSDGQEVRSAVDSRKRSPSSPLRASALRRSANQSPGHKTGGWEVKNSRDSSWKRVSCVGGSLGSGRSQGSRGSMAGSHSGKLPREVRVLAAELDEAARESRGLGEVNERLRAEVLEQKDANREAIQGLTIRALSSERQLQSASDSITAAQHRAAYLQSRLDAAEHHADRLALDVEDVVKERDAARAEATRLSRELETVSEALRVSRAPRSLLRSGVSGGGDGDLNVNVPALLGEVSEGRRRIAKMAGERDAAVAGLQEAERRRVAAQVGLDNATAKLLSKGTADSEEALFREAGALKTQMDGLVREMNDVKGALGRALDERDAALRGQNCGRIEVDAAQKAIRSLILERDGLRGCIEQVRGERDASSKALDALFGDRDAQKKSIWEARGERDAARAAADDLKGRLCAARGELEAAIRERDAAARERDEKVGEFETVLGERDGAISALERSESEKDAIEQTLKRVRGERNETEKALKVVKDELETARRELGGVRAELDAANTAREVARSELDAAEISIADVRGELDAAKVSLERMRGELDAATRDGEAVAADRDAAVEAQRRAEGELREAQRRAHEELLDAHRRAEEVILARKRREVDAALEKEDAARMRHVQRCIAQRGRWLCMYRHVREWYAASRMSGGGFDHVMTTPSRQEFLLGGVDSFLLQGRYFAEWKLRREYGG